MWGEWVADGVIEIVSWIGVLQGVLGMFRGSIAGGSVFGILLFLSSRITAPCSLHTPQDSSSALLLLFLPVQSLTFPPQYSYFLSDDPYSSLVASNTFSAPS